MKKYIIFASMGFELVGLVLGCFYLGEFLDQRYQTKGLIFVGLVFISLIGWLTRIVWMLRRLEKMDEESDANKSK